jgi:hypothetical protein
MWGRGKSEEGRRQDPRGRRRGKRGRQVVGGKGLGGRMIEEDEEDKGGED